MTIPEIIRDLLEEWPTDHLPEDVDLGTWVNQGSCVDFAQAVGCRVDVVVMGDSRLMQEMDADREPFGAQGCGHVWVTDGSRHYDAECPEGVDDWGEMPYFSR